MGQGNKRKTLVRFSEMKASNREKLKFPYSWCGRCVLPGAVSECHSWGTTMHHKQRVSHADLSFYASPGVTCSYSTNGFCAYKHFKWTHSKPQRKTWSQFSMKRCKIFIVNLLGSPMAYVSSIRFLVLARSVFPFLPTIILLVLKDTTQHTKIDAWWINLQCRPKQPKAQS